MSVRSQGFPNIAGQLLNRPLAIHPHKAEVLICALQQRLGIVSLETIDGITLEAREMNQRAAVAQRLAFAGGEPRFAASRKSYEMVGNIAHIRSEGTLVHKAGYLDAMSGITGYNMLAKQFREANADPDVLGIMFEHDSPGGTVAGMFALAQEIAMGTQEMGGKPVYSWVNEQSCSADYALSCVSDKLFAPAGALVGSIGCVFVHTSVARALDKGGVDVTIIRSGDRKSRGGHVETLDDKAVTKMQASVDQVRDQFVNLVSMARGLPVKKILATEGDWFDAEEALSIGLIDGLANEAEAWGRLEEEVDRIKRQRRRGA